jgi:predicted transcriptional regulator
LCPLLELIQEQQPTTTKFISQCLYERLGRGNNESTVQQALDKLRDLGFISYSEKLDIKFKAPQGKNGSVREMIMA